MTLPKHKVVTSPKACMDLIDLGNRNRCVGVSNLNEHSSRSHSIFRMVLESQENGEDAGGVRVSELNLVDLAGSETLTYDFGTVMLERFLLLVVKRCLLWLQRLTPCALLTLAILTGDKQQKETKAINLSLTNLKTVIEALSNKAKYLLLHP
jgi:hypothetical protein